MPVKTCEHVKVNGSICDSPALRGRHFCYYHLRSRVERPAIPILEDGASVQFAITEVLRAVAAHRIDVREAGILLYGLQTAAANLTNIHDPSSSDLALDEPGDDLDQLQGARLQNGHLQNGELQYGHLQNSEVQNSDLQSSSAQKKRVSAA